MKFTVDVPSYLRVEVEAVDDEAAAKAASDLVTYMSERPTSFLWHERGATLLSSRLVPFREDEDNEPDVYLCRGGKLNFVEADGAVTPTDEACD